MALPLHIPVMVKEVIEHLALRPGMTVVDATVGTAGHSEEILRRITPGGRLIGVDKDEDSLRVAHERLAPFAGSFELVHGTFGDLDVILQDRGIKAVDAMLFDLGISTYQLLNAERGFSFREEGPLDMRMDRSSYISAYDLVNNLNEEEISTLLRNFGQERFHNRIARLLVQEREKHPIATTAQLSDIVVRAVPHKFRYYRIHPATRTFQAVRIAVNRELETLEAAMDKAIELLAPGGRLCVISFHSLEDRVVKHRFRHAADEGIVELVTPKPLTPLQSEVHANPSSRSSKMRVAQRCAS